MPTRKSYCRFCHAYCALEVDVEEGRVQAVRGDASDPVYGGYTCIKGRQLPDRHNDPNRIVRALRRRPEGGFDEIPTVQALDEIASKVAGILEADGPRSVASYNGTHAFQNAAALAVSKAFHRAIGSESFYSSITIDQPGKFIAMGRAGIWSGGTHGFFGSDVVMIIGNNTIVSQYSPFGGIPAFNPVKCLRGEQRRGMKVICVDPRRTDVARRADLHLQLRPGEDPTLLASMLRLILEEELHEAAFCSAWTEGLAELRAAVAPFTLDYGAERCGVPAQQIAEAARLFARGPRGIASTGTGPDMAPHPNLTEHLVLALNFVCGRVNREGERLPNPGIVTRPTPRKAQPFPPFPVYGQGARSRVRGLGEVIGEMPTAALADEILEPGAGQVKALFCMGGNPVVAWPDQVKAVRAMEALELLVCVDVKLSATAKMADYVLPPRLSLERADLTLLTDTWYEVPYSHYTAPVAEPPRGSDVIEEWEVYWEVASRLGVPLRVGRTELPTDVRPTKDDVLGAVIAGGRKGLDELKAREGGQVFDDVAVTVEAADPDSSARIQLAPEGIPEELAEVRRELADPGFSHRLISRRLRHVYNSSGPELPALAEKGTTNRAFMHPDDLDALGLREGDVVEIASAHAEIYGVAWPAADVRPGVISMAHAFGDPAADPKQVRDIGSSTNRLVDAATDFDPISGMARQSAIPVNVRPAEGV
jgi:anaerobic selenocysteine-containing dehydrogenase